MTLALLLTAVTGAWATDVYVVGNGTGNWLNDAVWDPGVAGNKMTEQNGVYSITFTNVAANSELLFKFAINGTWDENYGCISDTKNELNKTLSNIEAFGTNIMFGLTEPADVTISFNPSEMTYMISTKGMKVGDDAPSGPEVAWDAAKKTGTFSMPAYDVEIAPIYAKAAAFATTGTEPEVKTLLPEAIEGIFAGTTDAIVKAGTVAMMGKTENPQGIVMYAVTSINQATAPELSAFIADVPTAENIADEGADVLVWYYIQGANTPDGQEATAENTFNDSEIFAEPIKITVLPNKYDIQFNAANANTIEAGKATVTVGGTAATVTEGKLQGVKMGIEVKVKANTGYKFRKVEVKKKEGDTGKSLAEATVGMIIGSNGKAYAADDKDNLPEGVTVAAKVCYVDGNGHGLALALTDEGTKDWSTAMNTCAAHTPAITGGTWKLASKDEWFIMISAAGSYSALRDGFSSVGGTNMKSNAYWSSTEYEEDCAWGCYFNNGIWDDNDKDANLSVRACLAF